MLLNKQIHKGTKKNYMGIALMVKAGIAIGLAIMAKVSLPHIGGVILNTIITTTVIYKYCRPHSNTLSHVKGWRYLMPTYSFSN